MQNEESNVRSGATERKLLTMATAFECFGYVPNATVVAAAEANVASWDPADLSMERILSIGKDEEQKVTNVLVAGLQATTAQSGGARARLMDLRPSVEKIGGAQQEIDKIRRVPFFREFLERLGVFRPEKRIERTMFRIDKFVTAQQKSAAEVIEGIKESATADLVVLRAETTRLQGDINAHKAFLKNMVPVILEGVAFLPRAEAYLATLPTKGYQEKAARDAYAQLVERLNLRLIDLMRAYKSSFLKATIAQRSLLAMQETSLDVSSRLLAQVGDIAYAHSILFAVTRLSGVQESDAVRNQVRDVLLKQGFDGLTNVALCAAAMPYERRLGDAQILCTLEHRIAELYDEITKNHQAGVESLHDIHNMLKAPAVLLGGAAA